MRREIVFALIACFMFTLPGCGSDGVSQEEFDSLKRQVERNKQQAETNRKAIDLDREGRIPPSILKTPKVTPTVPKAEVKTGPCTEAERRAALEVPNVERAMIDHEKDKKAVGQVQAVLNNRIETLPAEPEGLTKLKETIFHGGIPDQKFEVNRHPDTGVCIAEGKELDGYIDSRIIAGWRGHAVNMHMAIASFVPELRKRLSDEFEDDPRHELMMGMFTALTNQHDATLYVGDEEYVLIGADNIERLRLVINDQTQVEQLFSFAAAVVSILVTDGLVKDELRYWVARLDQASRIDMVKEKKAIAARDTEVAKCLDEDESGINRCPDSYIAESGRHLEGFFVRRRYGKYLTHERPGLLKAYQTGIRKLGAALGMTTPDYKRVE